VIEVATDDQMRLGPDVIAVAHREAERNGRRVFAIVGSACTTATGAFDPLDTIADYAESSRDGVDELDELQLRVREALVESGNFYVVKTRLSDGIYLRIAVMNARTNEEDLCDLLAAVREAAGGLQKVGLLPAHLDTSRPPVHAA